ncbi:MAG: DUF411 domain-containing protein [Chromatiales bacterium]|jgi:hypothetical protein|nr:MAG: DUF411 domain-containing protein [Chromatiales bacterium]
MWNRRTATGMLVSVVLLLASGAHADPEKAGQSADQPLVKVWKTPTCGCCGKWVRHMQAAGFRVEVTDVANVDPIKTANGLPLHLASCHTALVGGYVVEGHVPASDVRRLLAEKPDIVGLTAPGMPPGSPGMDVPGSPPFDVLSLGKDGKTAVYATHN